MSQYTDWFIAEESDAEAIADIGSDESDADFDDWPHLAMKSVLDSELMALWAILRGKPGKWESVDGEALAQRGDADEDGIGEEGLTIVSRVLPEFVTALASLTDAKLKEVVRHWRKDESMADWSVADATAVLKEMAAFAKRAEKEGKPVLQMTTV
jgi:hypothetical protein